MVHHVTAQQAAGVRETVRKSRAPGIEKQTNGLDRRRAEEDESPRVLALLHRLRVNHPHAARPTAFPVVQDLRHDAVRPQSEIAGLASGRKSGADAIEARMGDATLFAGAAVVAGEAPPGQPGEERPAAPG